MGPTNGWVSTLAERSTPWFVLGDGFASSVLEGGCKFPLGSDPPLRLSPPPLLVSSPANTLVINSSFLPDLLYRGVVREIATPEHLHFKECTWFPRGRSRGVYGLEDDLRPPSSLSAAENASFYNDVRADGCKISGETVVRLHIRP